MHHIRTLRNRHWSALTAAVLLAVAHDAPAASTEAPVTLRSLLEEMTSPDAVARFPQPSYQCLQASSYNRASTHRNQPKQDTSGWFADSDGTGFIRTETMNGKTEWVIMEHTGPGCLTKIWTPFFYYDFNICSRTRSLDAIPFTQRLVFDMESSFGTDIRNPWNLLGYSAAIFWYAKPGATHNRPALPELAARPIMALAEVAAKSEAIRAPAKAASTVGAGGYEFKLLKPTAMSPGLQAGPQRPDESFNPRQWSGEQHFIGPSTRARGTKTFMGLDRLVLKTPDGAQAKRPIRLFIIAGQSNAQGYNHIRQYRNGREEFPATLRAQPRILFWPGNDAPQATDNLWTTLRVGDSGSFGPEIGFASDVERLLPGTTIALVKYAVGGSGIARSADYTDYIPALAGYDDKGRNWHPPTAGREAGALYRALMANFRNAVAALERDGKPWELAGIVWMQGEHEAGISRKMAGDYEEILSGFISSVRKDLDAPSLPFVIGQINSHTWAFGDIARNCQVEVCRKDKRSLLVETVDLPRVNGDAAHFTADGMLTLGSRFAATMARLIPDLVPDGPK